MRYLFIAVAVLMSTKAYADCTQKINNTDDGEALLEALRCLNETVSELERSKVPHSELPSGIVAAFNGDACPAGWKEFVAGRGRVVVGTGRGDGLSGRVLGDDGGTETHTLLTAMTIRMMEYTISRRIGTRAFGRNLEGIRQLA